MYISQVDKIDVIKSIKNANLIEVNCSTNDARPNWGFKPLDGAILSHVFMILHFW